MNATPPHAPYIAAMTTMHAVEERRYALHVDGRRVAAGTCTPTGLHALAAGRLLSEGLLDGRTVAAIDVVEDASQISLHVDLRPLTAYEARAARANPAAPPLGAMPELFRELFRCGDERHPDGGIHVAALSDGDRLLHVQTDVGRHNAVDKTLGGALLIDTDASRLGLLLSARVSGEIASKAIAAGVGWIATRSVPTTLAVAITHAAGIPIVARAPSREPFVWNAAEQQ